MNDIEKPSSARVQVDSHNAASMLHICLMLSIESVFTPVLRSIRDEEARSVACHRSTRNNARLRVGPARFHSLVAFLTPRLRQRLRIVYFVPPSSESLSTQLMLLSGQLL